MSEVQDKSRRKFLIGACVGVAGVGGAFAAVPFVGSWSPSAKAKAAGAPIAIDVSKLASGSMLSGIQWRGKAIYVVKRTDEMLAKMEDLVKDEILLDPESKEDQQPEFAKNSYRAYEATKNISVLEGVCTHLGCAPKFKEKSAPTVGMIQGGFFCPCHGSRYDFSGRVYKGVPAPLNLVVPPYYFKDENTIIVGNLGGEA